MLTITNFFMSQVLPSGFIEDEKVRADVVKYFSSFDETIKGFEVSKLPSQEDSQEGGLAKWRRVFCG